MALYADPLSSTISTGVLLDHALSYGHYGTFLMAEGSRK